MHNKRKKGNKKMKVNKKYFSKPQYGFCESSNNIKLGKGKMSIVNGNFATCPDCPYVEGCFAKGFTCLMSVVKNCRYTLDELTERVRHARLKNIVRMNVSGDLAKWGTNDIDLTRVLWAIKNLCRDGRTVYTYTHCQPTDRNKKIVLIARRHGFIINWSCEDKRKAEALVAEGHLAVLATNEDFDSSKYFECRGGKGTTCYDCKMCFTPSRSKTPVFRFHGKKKAKAEQEALSSIKD